MRTNSGARASSGYADR